MARNGAKEPSGPKRRFLGEVPMGGHLCGIVLNRVNDQGTFGSQ
jgi:hypothetical protein